MEGYVNNYKTYLTNIRVDVSSARLITKSELEKLGCSSSSYSCSSAPNWVYSTSYWSGTVAYSEFIWFVAYNADFDSSYYRGGYYGSGDDFGVRPVIEIAEAEF